MVLYEMIVLAAALSIDAFAIGASCALRGIKNPPGSKLVICIVSVAVTAAAAFMGGIIGKLLPEYIGNVIGSVLLIILATYIAVGAVKEEKNKRNESSGGNSPFETAAKILRSPASCDMDKSSTVDIREALYIGAALSADSFSAGIGAGIGGAVLAVPILCGLFQLLLLCMGELLGKYLKSCRSIRQLWFSLLSAFMLAAIGVVKLFI